MKIDDNKIRSEIQNRELKIEADSMRADEESRTIEVCFSSELGVKRWFGTEILDHTSQSVRLDRLRGGAAVLVNHDSDEQVGVVVADTVRIDDDRRGRATLRFSKSAKGEEIFQDVKDGIRSLISVGYKIHKYEVTEREGEPDEVRVNDWEPYEISLVSIPADPSVGVNRSQEPNMDPNQNNNPAPAAPADPQNRAAPAFDAAAETRRLQTEETKRRESIIEIADKYELTELREEGLSEGWSVADFNEKALEEVGKRNNAAKSEMEEEIDLGLSRTDKSKFSFVSLMEALSNPNDRSAQKRAGHELAVCAAAEAKMPGDFNARGNYIPPEIIGDALHGDFRIQGRGGKDYAAITGAQRDLSAGTATDGAELVATNLLAGDYIEVLRNNMVTLGLGVRMLPGLVGDVAIPRQTSGAAMTWITAEDGDATESEPQFDQVTLSPKDAAVYTEVTRRLTQQSTPAIEGIVRNDIYQAIATGLDAAIFNGSGASGQPQGINGATGVDDPTIVSALAPTYEELVTVVQTIMESNALRGVPAWAISPAVWQHLMTTPVQTGGVEGAFILATGRIVGFQQAWTTQLASGDFCFGDFTNVLVGEWGGLELNVDPFTHSLKGKTRFVAFKTVDTAIRHPEALSFHDAA